METNTPPTELTTPIGFSSSPLETEKQKLLDRITELESDGFPEQASQLRQKHKDILNPTIPFPAQEHLSKFITTDPHMLKVKHDIGLLSRHWVMDTVLIQGPTGTGKEILSRALHGDRNVTKFVAINCAAMPEHLLESELFGHVKGAFTGAVMDKEGLFKTAETLFLDEIGELPYSIQAKLLRVLQEKVIRPVGSNCDTRVDRCRVIAATLKDMDNLVAAGKFREDLYWRINTFHVKLSGLEDRPEDIPLITNDYATQVEVKENGKIPAPNKWDKSYRIKASLLKGNVRSIQQIVRRRHVLGEMPNE